jgi:CRP-like cAMP-binding protein
MEVNMKETEIGRIKRILRELPFFEDFSDDNLEYFSKQLSLRLVPANTTMFNEGDVGDYLFFIIEGRVDIRLDSSPSKKIIASFGWGSSVGEMALIDDYPRAATVIATEPSEILILTKARFTRLNKDNPDVANKLLMGLAKSLSMRLRSQTGRFIDLA